jgi:biotin synthase
MRKRWTVEKIRKIYELPLPELVFRAMKVHRKNHNPAEIQRSTLLSVKTGGCPEDCAYCPQSAHYDTSIQKHAILPRDYVLQKAREAKAEGSTRFCMGVAWRDVRDGADFDAILELVRGVDALGLEVCCTLGMLNEDQARRLKEAGCQYYNHNLDTSPEYYGKIITTRTYEDRLNTLKNVRQAGISICCGGIIGMGESIDDRLGLLKELANQDSSPESVPINALQTVKGTPLDGNVPVDPIEFIRMIATARIIMPESCVRLSAGRVNMSDEAQALCFLAGASSIFSGERLLTQQNAGDDHDAVLMKKLGMSYIKAAPETHAEPAGHAHLQIAD